jgi:hypothetical protein
MSSACNPVSLDALLLLYLSVPHPPHMSKLVHQFITPE